MSRKRLATEEAVLGGRRLPQPVDRKSAALNSIVSNANLFWSIASYLPFSKRYGLGGVARNWQQILHRLDTEKPAAVFRQVDLLTAPHNSFNTNESKEKAQQSSQILLRLLTSVRQFVHILRISFDHWNIGNEHIDCLRGAQTMRFY